MSLETTHHHRQNNVAWRHCVAPPPPPPRFADESTLDRAWLALQLRHTSSNDTPAEEYHHLSTELRVIEEMALRSSSLGSYWAECSRPVGDRIERETMSMATDLHHELLHLIMMQLRLMEHAFLALRLHRYPNAPSNRGWMNLFRCWGQSDTLNRQLRADRGRLGAVFSSSFMSFYDEHLRNAEGTIDESPVPHPWDPPRLRMRGGREVRGLYLDPGIREARGSDVRRP